MLSCIPRVNINQLHTAVKTSDASNVSKCSLIPRPSHRTQCWSTNAGEGLENSSLAVTYIMDVWRNGTFLLYSFRRLSESEKGHLMSTAQSPVPLLQTSTQHPRTLLHVACFFYRPSPCHYCKWQTLGENAWVRGFINIGGKGQRKLNLDYVGILVPTLGCWP